MEGVTLFVVRRKLDSANDDVWDPLVKTQENKPVFRV